MEFLPGEWQGFPYAVRLAEERGAVAIFIQPRITDETVQGWVVPDLYAIMPSGVPLIVEVEDSSGAKFKKGGPRNRESALLSKAHFVFVIGLGAKGRCENKLRQYFGSSVELVYLEDLKVKYGELGLASRIISGA